MSKTVRPKRRWRDHDALYRRLLSDPALVAQLIRGFVDGPWIAHMDFDAMERLDTTFHADAGQRRHSDMIWRIPNRGGNDSYLVLLLEFQSKAYRYMALRMLVYSALLLQQRVNQRAVLSNGKLPPILPVVLYNGKTRWSAPVTVGELVGLPKESSLWPWQPEIRYRLVDIGSFDQAELRQKEGLAPLWFRLETALDTEQILVVVDEVLAWLARHPGYEAAQAVFADLVRAMVAPVGPGILAAADLQEVRNMLATRAEQWKQDWLSEGEQKGREIGEQKGRATLLLRQLQHRFGALPNSVSDRVLAADTDQLEHWGVRILDAGSLIDLIGEPKA
jgi:hypothetical protein